MSYTDATESESEENGTAPKCSCVHDGKLLVDEIYSAHIDELFTMLFTNSPFFMELQEMRKATNVVPGSWCDEPDGSKTRVVAMTIPLAQTIGPKSADVTDTQVMHPCSEPGLMYSIDSKIESRGIPYADRFYLAIHFCIVKCSDQKTSLEIYADVIYTQKVWGFVKSVIDKNSWQGLERTYASLKDKLRNAIDENANAPHKRRIRQRRKRRSSAYKQPEEIDDIAIHERVERFHVDLSLLIVIGFLILLLVINVYLFYKVWSLEHLISHEFAHSLDIRSKMADKHQSLDNLLTNQFVQSAETDMWLKVISTTIKYLKHAEVSLHRVMSSEAGHNEEPIE
ncbi:hypothetical protein Trydic_g13207 [Trypoxylus dichotomus]